MRKQVSLVRKCGTVRHKRCLLCKARLNWKQVVKRFNHGHLVFIHLSQLAASTVYCFLLVSLTDWVPQSFVPLPPSASLPQRGHVFTFSWDVFSSHQLKILSVVFNSCQLLLPHVCTDTSCLIQSNVFQYNFSGSGSKGTEDPNFGKHKNPHTVQSYAHTHRTVHTFLKA